MIVVRYVFQAKWGHAGKAAKAMIEMTEGSRERMGETGALLGRVRVLTDLSGSFDTVVQEMEFASLADWEKFRTAMFASEAFEDEMVGENPFVSGRAELYTLETAV